MSIVIFKKMLLVGAMIGSMVTGWMMNSLPVELVERLARIEESQRIMADEISRIRDKLEIMK